MNGLEQHRILVVEDETHLANGIKFNLEAEGYAVTTVDDGRNALDLIEGGAQFQLIVLDIMLPGMSGYDFCERFRERDRETPVLILTARTLREDRARGFDVGANQYMTKPFDLEEFLSRVNNLLTFRPRRAVVADETFTFGDATVNFTTYEAFVKGQPVKLTGLEMRFLKYLIDHAGRVIPKAELMEKVWDMPGDIRTRAPDQFLRRLRKTFEPNPANPIYFITVRDAGYRFLPKGRES
jgi:DNA-binding response OmpR family regulator